MQEINIKDATTSNVLNLGGLTLEASGDRIIVVEDEFKSGYECLTCEGVGSLVCENCNGTGKSSISKDARCSQCQGRKSVVCPECNGKTVVKGGIVVPEASERRPTTGTIVSLGPDQKQQPCATCAGFGNMPEIRQIKQINPYKETPIEDSTRTFEVRCDICKGSGTVARYSRGQSVIYTSFSGHVFELNAFDLSGREIVIVIRVIQESDILAKVSGHLELRRVKKSAAVGSAA